MGCGASSDLPREEETSQREQRQRIIKKRSEENHSGNDESKSRERNSPQLGPSGVRSRQDNLKGKQSKEPEKGIRIPTFLGLPGKREKSKSTEQQTEDEEKRTN